MALSRARYFFLTLYIFEVLTACNTTLLYHPTRLVYFDPSRMGFPAEERWIDSGDGTKLHGFRMIRTASAVDKRTIVLFLHGNAENISSHFISVAWLVDHGYDILMYDYRGFGLSEGEVDHGAIQDDVLAMLQAGAHLSAKEQKRYVVYGQSLGGILAARGLIRWSEDHAGYRPPDLLILDSTFGSYQQIGAEKLSKGCLTPFAFLPYILLSDRHSVIDDLDRIAPLPVLVVHGDRDDIVPVQFGEELFRRVQSPKRLLIVRGGTHAAWAGLGRAPAAKTFLKMMEEMLAGRVSAADPQNQDVQQDVPASR